MASKDPQHDLVNEYSHGNPHDSLSRGTLNPDGDTNPELASEAAAPTVDYGNDQSSMVVDLQSAIQETVEGIWEHPPDLAYGNTGDTSEPKTSDDDPNRSLEHEESAAAQATDPVESHSSGVDHPMTDANEPPHQFLTPKQEPSDDLDAMSMTEDPGPAKRIPTPLPPSQNDIAIDEEERRVEELREKFRQRVIADHSRPSQRVPVLADSETEEANLTAAFKVKEAAYKKKQEDWQTTQTEEIEFMKLRQKEERRQKRASNKRALQSEALPEKSFNFAGADPLFFTDDDDAIDNEDDNTGRQHESDDDCRMVSPPPTQKRLRQSPEAKVPAAASKQAVDVGIGAMKHNNKVKKTRSKGLKKDPKRPRKPRTKKAKGPQMASLNTLLRNDIVSAAQANQGKGPQPGFTARNKREGLNQLLAGLSDEDRDVYRADKQALDQAAKAFTHRMRPDGQSGWKLTGMLSSLFHYQLLGSAFMRDRENSTGKPHGGLVADDMGLGKTVTCLANIVDDVIPPGRPKTTLIVCPAALCSQWMSEIKKHVAPETFREVFLYRSGSRIHSADPVKTLSNANIVITTFSEVLRSYPDTTPPAHLITQEAKDEYWAKRWNGRGPLHRILFRRIVLDEAQAIKNHTSKTSIAVRALEGKYRWALSGTPIQNRIEEFFPYFAFLKVNHTGNYETFKTNFGSRTHASNQRLQFMLKKIMIRRTHYDSLFGRPLLSLPGLFERTIVVKFNPTERAIYKIVNERFRFMVQGFQAQGIVRSQYYCIFTLFLRLRQLVSHSLLIQPTLVDLLEAEDLEKLWKITAAEERPTAVGRHKGVMDELRVMITRAYQNRGSQDDDTGSKQMDEMIFGLDDPSASKFGLVFDFRRMLLSLRQEGQWQKAIDRSLCHRCGSVPTNAHITSCMHIYCKDCIKAIQYEAGSKDDIAGPVQAECLECQTVFANVEPCQAYRQAGKRLSQRNGTPSRRTADAEGENLDWVDAGETVLPSAKTIAVKVQIVAWQRQDPDAKIIVFTQFRTMIKILSRIMEEENLGYAQFHGDMTFSARDKAIEDFRSDPHVKVLLASLKAGGVGLNLTMASKVILLDLWWNESVENQAFCRSYRIGQERPVDVCRIVIKDTIDDRLMQMQLRKTKEIDKALKDRPGKLPADQLIQLFDPIPTNDNPDAFIMVEPDAQNDDVSDGEVPTQAPRAPY